MGKRKTGKVKDLIVKAEKLTKEELDNLQKTVRSVDMMFMNVGKLEAQKHQLMHAIDDHNTEIRSIQGTLELKYGKCDIDIRDGKLTYDDVKADS